MDHSPLPSGWQRNELGELVSFSSGGTPSKEKHEYWNGDIPWVTAKDMKSFELSSSQLKITAEGLRHGGRTVPANSLLVLVRGMTLLKDVPICITTREVAFNQDVRGLQVKGKLNSRYLAYALVAQKEQLRGLVNIAGHGTGRLATEVLSAHPIIFPVDPEEQWAIAAVLSAWDRAIKQTTELIAAKERLKQSLMQQFLTGKRRFKKYKGDWRDCHLGELVEEVRRYVDVEDATKYRLVSVRRNSGGLFDREQRLGREIGYSRLMIVEDGDFLIARRQVIHGAMTMVRKRFAGAFVSDAYATLVVRPGVSLHMPFLNVLSQTSRMYYSAFRCSYGVAIEKMVFHLEWFLREKVVVPPTTEEQQQIASTLGDLDRQITLLQRQRNALQKQKRGLMQKLLAGEVRVPKSLLKRGAKG
ncbi:MAG: restriction endonuclease subunit S [Aureliella sp.]